MMEIGRTKGLCLAWFKELGGFYRGKGGNGGNKGGEGGMHRI